MLVIDVTLLMFHFERSASNFLALKNTMNAYGWLANATRLWYVAQRDGDGAQMKKKEEEEEEKWLDLNVYIYNTI